MGIETSFSHCRPPDIKQIVKEQKEIASVEEGLSVALEGLQKKLEQTKSRPLVVFINGETGSGKSTFSMSLENLLASHNIKAIDVETDLYQNDRFSESEFAEHKVAWEQGQPFTRHNLQTRQDETVINPDIIMVTGGGANVKHLGMTSDFNIVLVGNPLDRIARRITRDHIKKTDTTPNPDHFLRELGEPEDPADDLLDRMEAHRKELVTFISDADLIIKNNKPNKDLSLTIENNTLHFTAVHDGTTYDIVQPISPERLARIKDVLKI